MSANPSPRPGRCSAQEKRLRVEQLAAAIAAGEEPISAAKRLCKEWGVSSRRNLRRYLASVFESWKGDRELARAGSFGVALAVRREVVRRAMKNGDYGAALKAQGELDGLLGVDERDRAIDDERIKAALVPLVGRLRLALEREFADPELLRRAVHALAAAFDPNGGDKSSQLPPIASASEPGWLTAYRKSNPGKPYYFNGRVHEPDEPPPNGTAEPPPNGSAGPDRVVFDE